jgi:mRNA deadenylase 3'-5' endonuclease subunit Ccr4
MELTLESIKTQIVFMEDLFHSCHFFLNFQANTHINVHQDLKDVKLWEVCITMFYLLVFIPYGQIEYNYGFSRFIPS